LECREAAVLECRDAAALECREAAVLECREAAVLECRDAARWRVMDARCLLKAIFPLRRATRRLKSKRRAIIQAANETCHILAVALAEAIASRELKSKVQDAD
jgi:hypothetical protein